MLALNTGIRYSEIRLLRWRQLDFAARILTVGKSKSPTGSGRVVPLNTRILCVVSRQKSKRRRKGACSRKVSLHRRHCFRARVTNCWSERPQDTILAGTELDFVVNVVGTTPLGRIGGADRPAEGKKRPLPLWLSMIGDWESPCLARDEFGRDSSARSQRGVASDDARSER